MQHIHTMAYFIKARDQYTPLKQVGENANVEHCWSHTLDEMIVQFFFQLVRCEDHSELEQKLRSILSVFMGQESQHLVQMCTMYKLIGQTRDIIAGKGEQQLAFLQLWVWYEFYPELAADAFDHFVLLHGDETQHPYGSWKDIKYWCEYVRKKSGDPKHPLIERAIDIAIRQLLYDETRYDSYEEDRDNQESQPFISLCGKWLPREKSKFGWLFHNIANRMFGHFQDTANTEASKRKAKLKGRIILKKLLVKLNRYLDTAQIKMCCKDWSKLNFNHITSQTLRRRKLAVMNITKMNKQRSTDPDRIQCAENYKHHIKAAMVDPERHKIHGKRCAVYELVADAFGAHALTNPEKKQLAYDTVNLQCENNRTNNKGLHKLPIVSMVDTSSSMIVDSCIPLYNAIGLGIRASELTHTAFRHRCLTFNAEPQWINLEGCPDFVSKVMKIHTSPWGMNTNFYKALQLILGCILKNNIPPKQVSGMILAVFSDMQIDQRWSGLGSLNTMFEEITEMYAEAGLQSEWAMPYKPPHILFWNLRKTTGFPALSTEKNITMLSGYSSTLLNVFCNKGIEALRECTPRKMLEDLLSNGRYIPLEERVVARFA